jgi:diaminopimelate dehydrogenase
MRVGIVGYGNLGKAIERIVKESKDIDLVGIFTRRNPNDVKSVYCTPIYRQDDVELFKGEIDLLFLCTGSAKDLKELATRLGQNFNTVDAYDNHKEMREFVATLDDTTKRAGHLSVVGAGWDPGLFSLVRGLFEGISKGVAHTFWGAGVSQGHSEAIRRIEGVKMAVQYTLPSENAIERARMGDCDHMSPYKKHRRVCYVVADDLADKVELENEIKHMPNYFLGYDTEVHFISEDEFVENHQKLHHGGLVVCSKNIDGKKSTMELNLKLDSNPLFTASVMVAYGRCAHRLFLKGERGVKTVLDLPATVLFDDKWLDIVEKYL